MIADHHRKIAEALSFEGGKTVQGELDAIKNRDANPDFHDNGADEVAIQADRQLKLPAMLFLEMITFL
jgi:hypothetical protein